MQVEVFAALIAAFVSIIVSSFSAIISIFQNRKTRRVSVVTNQTIEHKEKVFQNVSNILALTHPLLVDDPCENDFLLLKKKILIECSQFEIRIRPIYDEAFEQITAMRTLVKIFFKCLKKQNDNNTEKIALSAAHTKFRELMSCFDDANWSYIKEQSDGKKMKKDTFKGLYKSQVENFTNKEKKREKKLPEWLDNLGAHNKA
jgi:hypothetical protein